MSKDDEFRAYARECHRMAGRTADADEKFQWLRLAQSWLRMVEPKASRLDPFEAVQAGRGTGQDPSTSSH